MIHVLAAVSTVVLMLGGGPDLDVPDVPDNEVRLAKAAEEPPPPPPAPAPFQAATPSGTPSYATWIAVAECESGYGGPPRWDLNTGNGFLGGLQWVHSTWLWMGGDDFAHYPHHATAEQEIAVANRLWSYERSQGRGGFNPWPACADKLGLPR